MSRGSKLWRLPSNAAQQRFVWERVRSVHFFLAWIKVRVLFGVEMSCVLTGRWIWV